MKQSKTAKYVYSQSPRSKAKKEDGTAKRIWKILVKYSPTQVK